MRPLGKAHSTPTGLTLARASARAKGAFFLRSKCARLARCIATTTQKRGENSNLQDGFSADHHLRKCPNRYLGRDFFFKKQMSGILSRHISSLVFSGLAYSFDLNERRSGLREFDVKFVPFITDSQSG